jgi:hypothetical protein
MNGTTTRPSDTTLLSVMAAAWMCLASHAQMPVPMDELRKPSMPVQLPQFKQRPSVVTPSGAGDAARFLTVGKDAAIGMVASDAAPGDSNSMLALVVDGPSLAVRESEGTLFLVDGQRIPGKLELRGGVPSWVSPWCAPRAMDGDGVRGFSLGTAALPAAADSDAVLLRNGDRIDGIVAGITATGITVEVGSGTERSTSTLAWDAVSAVGLVAPPTARSGARVWLADGTVIDGDSVSWMTPQYMRIVTGGSASQRPISIPRRMVLAMQASPASATPLARLSPVASGITAPAVRYSQPSPTVVAGTWGLDAPPIEIEGPVRLSYPAQATPSRLVAVASRPSTAREASSIALVIRSGGKELLREQMDASRARMEIRVDIPAAPFEIELVPSSGSAAGAFVVLERAVLFPR